MIVEQEKIAFTPKFWVLHAKYIKHLILGKFWTEIPNFSQNSSPANCKNTFCQKDASPIADACNSN